MKTIAFSVQDDVALGRMRSAAATGYFDGREATPYLDGCRWFWERYGCVVIFTRDVGYHSGGWWKNPDYERCYHLSVSFLGERKRAVVAKLLTGLFGWQKKLVWVEPPYSKEGKEREVWHYRLFCDPKWEAVKPRGEVYSTQFTELGWKSYSELSYR